MEKIKLIYKLPVTAILLCIYGICVTVEVVFKACSDLAHTRKLQMSAHEYFLKATSRGE